jgi:hypothetical protein
MITISWDFPLFSVKILLILFKTNVKIFFCIHTCNNIRDFQKHFKNHVIGPRMEYRVNSCTMSTPTTTTNSSNTITVGNVAYRVVGASTTGSSSNGSGNGSGIQVGWTDNIDIRILHQSEIRAGLGPSPTCWLGLGLLLLKLKARARAGLGFGLSS